MTNKERESRRPPATPARTPSRQIKPTAPTKEKAVRYPYLFCHRCGVAMGDGSVCERCGFRRCASCGEV